MPRRLHWQILAALGLAIPLGIWQGPDGALLPTLDLVGDLFLDALKMLVVPLIFGSIVAGLVELADRGALGRLGIKTMVYYLASSALAIVVGLAVVNLVRPGIIDGQPAGERMGLSAETDEVVARVQAQDGAGLAGLIRRMVPDNIVAAAADGQMLGLIFFALLFGGCASVMQGSAREVQQRFWSSFNEVMLRVTGVVMRAAPIGVLALVAKVFATAGWGAMAPMLYFLLTVLAALALHLFVTLPLLLRFVGRVDPWAHLRAMSPALLTAFSTSSSAATLPVTMECVRERSGVSPTTSGFVLPLGATVNMDGTALYECVAAIFIAQAYGVPLDFATQLLVVWTALLTSIGVAGVPSASLVAIAVILGAVGLPLEGIGLLLVTDRVLDMCRTAVNVYSDSCGAVIIARREGEATAVGLDGRR